MTKTIRNYHQLTIFDIVCTPNGSHAITGDSNGQVILWNLRTGLKDRLLLQRENEYIESLSISPDGTTILVGATDWVVSLSDLSGEVELYRWADEDARLCLAKFAADGKLVVIGGFDDRVFLWDLEEKAIQQSFHRPWPSDELQILAISPDGSQVAGGYGRTGSIHVWDAKTGCVVGILQNPFLPSLMGLEYSPDGQYMLTSGGKIMLWNPQNGDPIKSLKGVSDFLGVARFSPDSQSIVAADDKYQVFLFDIESGTELQRFLGHTATVRQQYFVPDGKCLLTCSADGTARMWDIQTGNELLRMSPRASS